jgi:tripartite-type tricarboxylate transporter receptor subunit TctC
MFKMHYPDTDSRPSPRREFLFALGAGLSTLSGVATAQPAAYPHRAVKFMVPYAAGGGVDKIARVIGQQLAKSLGQPIVIDNRGGAAGNIGTELAVRAEPDGYTILMGAAALAINATLYRNLAFDPVKDLVPVSLIAKTPNIVVVHPEVPVKSIKELVALAKSKPGALNYASAGSGTTSHLAAELLDSVAGIKMTHIPYKGTAPAVTGILGAEVQVMLAPALTVLPYIKAGKLRALATTGAERSSAFPDTPTVSQSGYPGFEASQWYGVLAPAGTPEPILARLNADLVKAVQSTEVRTALLSEGSEPIGSTREAFDRYLKAEIARWAKAIPADQRLN